MARSWRSPLAKVIWVIFHFSATVLAVSAVLGVDLGTEYIKAALVKPGIPLEIVLTKDSRRKEISAVAFKPSSGGPKQGSYPERAYGSDAMALSARFPGDVYPNLKTLLGLPADSREVKEYAARHPALQLEAHKLRGTATFKSSRAFTPEEEAFMVEELLAMELQSIRANAEALAGAGSSVRSVVMTVPSFYTTEEKRAVELAAELAGFKVLSLISDSLAVGLNYATTRTFPNINDGGKPEHHMVFDMGAGSTKASVLKFQSRTVKDIGKFNKTIQEVQVLGSAWDKQLAGDQLNYLVVDDMVSKFVESDKARKASVAVNSVKAHGRAVATITKEAERLRHVLSANQNTQASFEGLYDDVDFKYKISRADFEAMASPHAHRVESIVRGALETAKLEIADLDSIILHGGASRTPFVQKELENLLVKAGLDASDKIRTNVNADESAVFGAGFRAAEISPSFRVKEIRVIEAAGYPVGMKWKTDGGKAQHQRLWTSSSALGGAAKEVTLSNHDDLAVTFYQQVTPGPNANHTAEAEVKVLTTKNLTASVVQLVEKYKCDKADIKLKLSTRLSNSNGEVEVLKASVECETEEVEKETLMTGVKNLLGFGGKKDQQPLGGPSTGAEEAETSSTAPADNSSDANSTSSSDSEVENSTETASGSGDAKAAVKKKQLVSVAVNYTLDKAGLPQLPEEDLLAVRERIKALDVSDRTRLLREETFNRLEGFTYKVRELLDSQAFIAASTLDERSKLQSLASETSDWLYGDGADSSRDELKARLKKLHDIVDPVQKRIEEAGERPDLVKKLKEALDKTREFLTVQKQEIAAHEAIVSSQQAASASSASANSDASSDTAATSTDDFAGLEDDDASTSSKTGKKAEDIAKDPGPVPPPHTLDDLKESEGLHTSISAWLSEKEAEQNKLGATDDPVLLAKDLVAKRAKLDKAGADLAMKSARYFEKIKRDQAKLKKSKSKSSQSGGSKKNKLEPDADGNMPSQEEIEEMIRKWTDSKSSSSQSGGPKKLDLEPDADGNIRTREEIEEMIRKFTKSQGTPEPGTGAEKEKAKPEDKKRTHEEL